MSWVLASTPGHAGALIGLVEVPRGDPRSRFGDRFRELTPADDGPVYPAAVQVGCTCGWRSARMDAPIDCCWWPARTLETSAWFAEVARAMWREHATAPTLGDQAGLFTKAGG